MSNDDGAEGDFLHPGCMRVREATFLTPKWQAVKSLAERKPLGGIKVHREIATDKTAVRG